MKERISILFVWCGYVLIYGTLLFFLHQFDFYVVSTLKWIYQHAEWLALVGIGAFLGVERLPTIGKKRPFNHVPWEGVYWEFRCVWTHDRYFFVVFPGSWNLYRFNPSNLDSDQTDVCLCARTAGYANKRVDRFSDRLRYDKSRFAAVYLTLLLNEKGNLVRAQKNLYGGKLGEGWPLGEVYYFSLSTMLKGTPQYDGTGWCRWAALAQVAVARLIEVGVVTVGIGAILKRGLLGPIGR